MKRKVTVVGGAGKWLASVNGGTAPGWCNDGTELYYVEGGTLMAVSVSTESAFILGRPQPLLEAPGLALAGSIGATSLRRRPTLPDDRARRGAETALPKIRLVQDWYEEIRKRQQ